jgi:hypothetical protein
VGIRNFHLGQEEGLRLQRSWGRFFSGTRVDGQAFGNPGGQFTPGMFVKQGDEAETRLMQIFDLGFMPSSMLYRGPETISRMHRDPEWRKLIRKWCNPARYKAFMKETSYAPSGLSFKLSGNVQCSVKP